MMPLPPWDESLLDAAICLPSHEVGECPLSSCGGRMVIRLGGEGDEAATFAFLTEEGSLLLNADILRCIFNASHSPVVNRN